MQFTIHCECGEPLSVGTADAGGTKRCYCGALNRVPSLRELNRQGDSRADDDLIADKLRYMHAAGNLPPQKACIQCGCETTSILACSVTCASPYAKGHRYWTAVLLSCYHLIFALSRDYRNPEVHGEDLTVSTPLPLCQECAADASITKTAIRDLLCRIPLYAQLFSAYPNAVAHRSPDLQDNKPMHSSRERSRR